MLEVLAETLTLLNERGQMEEYRTMFRVINPKSITMGEREGGREGGREGLESRSNLKETIATVEVLLFQRMKSHV